MWYTRNRFVRAVSDFQARIFSGTSANMISVYRMLMTPCLPLLIVGQTRPLATIVFIIAVYLDFVDGAVARYQRDELGFRTCSEDESSLSFFARLRLKGCTETGKWLDPLADKFLVQTTIFALGWNILPLPFLLIGLILSVALTLARPFKAWMKKRGLRKTADGHANGFGKLKMWCEVCVIIALFIGGGDDFTEALLQIFTVYVLTSTAIALACLSLIFHLMPARTLK